MNDNNNEFLNIVLGGTKIIDAILNLDIFKDEVGVSNISRKNALEDAKKHLTEHLIKIEIKAKKLDSYKLISWYGFYLSNHADDPKHIIRIATIVALNKVLKQETEKSLKKDILSEMCAMAIKDGTDDKFGIGKNGVYNTFKACSSVLAS
jgi:hypothetical protein